MKSLQEKQRIEKDAEQLINTIKKKGGWVHGEELFLLVHYHAELFPNKFYHSANPKKNDNNILYMWKDLMGYFRKKEKPFDQRRDSN